MMVDFNDLLYPLCTFGDDNPICDCRQDRAQLEETIWFCRWNVLLHNALHTFDVIDNIVMTLSVTLRGLQEMTAMSLKRLHDNCVHSGFQPTPGDKIGLTDKSLLIWAIMCTNFTDLSALLHAIRAASLHVYTYSSKKGQDWTRGIFLQCIILSVCPTLFKHKLLSTGAGS